MRLADHLELTTTQVQINPITGADRSEAATIERLGHDMRNRDAFIVIRNTPGGDSNRYRGERARRGTRQALQFWHSGRRRSGAGKYNHHTKKNEPKQTTP